MGAGSNNGGMEAYAASLTRVTADSASSQNAEGSHLLQGWLCNEGWPIGGIPKFENGFSVSIVIWGNVLGTPLDGMLLREADFLTVSPHRVFVCLHFKGLASSCIG